jgi:hypothetical protein
MLSYRNTLQLLISQQLARNMLSAVGPGSGPADGRLTIRVPVVALIDLLGPTAKYTLAVGTHMLCLQRSLSPSGARSLPCAASEASRQRRPRARRDPGSWPPRSRARASPKSGPARSALRRAAPRQTDDVARRGTGARCRARPSHRAGAPWPTSRLAAPSTARRPKEVARRMLEFNGQQSQSRSVSLARLTRPADVAYQRLLADLCH